MSKEYFLYKDNTEDRDCCAYIEKPSFKCGHYFGRINLQGACYSGRSWAEYEDIKTILTKEEYQMLISYNEKVADIGFGIEKNSQKYEEGMRLCANLQPIFDKLNSPESEDFFEEIQQEEIEYLCDEYGFDEDDVQDIFDSYGLDYRDRAIVAAVYDNPEDFGYNEAVNLGYIDSGDQVIDKYFDYARFGQDLVDEDENYIQLDDGRVVCLNY